MHLARKGDLPFQDAKVNGVVALSLVASAERRRANHHLEDNTTESPPVHHFRVSLELAVEYFGREVSRCAADGLAKACICIWLSRETKVDQLEEKEGMHGNEKG